MRRLHQPLFIICATAFHLRCTLVCVVLLLTLQLQAGETNGGASTLRVITYNVQFLPEPATWKNERPNPEYRIERIAQELKNFDVVGLQELFHEPQRDKLIERTRAVWVGKLEELVSKRSEGFHTSGGCAARPSLQQGDVNLYQDAKVGALSDQNAVSAEFDWPASAHVEVP